MLLWEDRFLTTPTLRFAAQSLGTFGDPPLVLIMGATASRLWWPESLCQMLACAGCFVIRYDNRDTGETSTVAPGVSSYSVDDLMEDLWVVMDGYELPSAHLVGMSLGGMIAQMAALARPERVLSLTLIASEPLGGCEEPAPGLSADFLAHFSTMAELDWGDREAVVEFMVEVARLSAGSGRPFDERAARSRAEAEFGRTSSMQSAFNHATLQGGDGYSGRLGEISAPALILHGSEDPIINVVNGKSLARQIPNARLEILEEVGHELPQDVLPGIASEILDFVNQVEARLRSRQMGHAT